MLVGGNFVVLDFTTVDDSGGSLFPMVEQVRRAIIDGRQGMPKGLLGGADVDQIARYLSGQAQ